MYLRIQITQSTNYSTLYVDSGTNKSTSTPWVYTHTATHAEQVVGRLAPQCITLDGAPPLLKEKRRLRVEVHGTTAVCPEGGQKVNGGCGGGEDLLQQGRGCVGVGEGLLLVGRLPAAEVEGRVGDLKALQSCEGGGREGGR